MSEPTPPGRPDSRQPLEARFPDTRNVLRYNPGSIPEYGHARDVWHRNPEPWEADLLRVGVAIDDFPILFEAQRRLGRGFQPEEWNNFRNAVTQQQPEPYAIRQFLHGYNLDYDRIAYELSGGNREQQQAQRQQREYPWNRWTMRARQYWTRRHENWQPDIQPNNNELFVPPPSEQSQAGENFPYRGSSESPQVTRPGEISRQDRAAIQALRDQLGNGFDFRAVDRQIARQDLSDLSRTILGRDMEPALLDAIANSFNERDAQDYTRLLAENISPTNNTVGMEIHGYGRRQCTISLNSNGEVNFSFNTQAGPLGGTLPLERFFGMIQPRLEAGIQPLGSMFERVNTTPNPDTEHYTRIVPTDFPIRTREHARRYIPNEHVPFLTAYGAHPRTVPFAYENPTAPDGSRRDRRDASYALGEAVTNFDSGLFALAKASAGSTEEQATLYRTYANAILTIHQLEDTQLFSSWLQAQGNLNANPPSSLHQIYNYDRENGQLRDPDNQMLGYDRSGYSAEATRILWENRRRDLQALFAQAPIQLEPHHIRWMEFLSHAINVDQLARDIRDGYTPEQTTPEEPVAPAPVGQGAFS